MTDQDTAPLDLDGLERDLRRSNPDHSVLIRVSEALALISQAREAERMRGAAQAAYDSLIELNEFNYTHDDVCDANAGAVEAMTTLHDALCKWRAALAPATGGEE